MSTVQESAQSPQHNEPHVMVPEAVMNEIALELGTAAINRILMANTLRGLQSTSAATADQNELAKKKDK